MKLKFMKRELLYQVLELQINQMMEEMLQDKINYWRKKPKVTKIQLKDDKEKICQSQRNKKFFHKMLNKRTPAKKKN